MLGRATGEIRLAFADATAIASLVHPRHRRRLESHRGLFRRLLRDGALCIATGRPEAPETVAVQTVIQLDGDVTSKISPDALADESLLEAHRKHVGEILAPLLGAPALVRMSGRALTLLFVGSSTLLGGLVPAPRTLAALVAIGAFLALRRLAHPLLLAGIRRRLLVG